MPSMFIGGAEKSLIGLLDSLKEDDIAVDLFLFRHEGDREHFGSFLHVITEEPSLLKKLSTKILRKLLKIKIIIVYLQPVKMCYGT